MRWLLLRLSGSSDSSAEARGYQRVSQTCSNKVLGQKINWQEVFKPLRTPQREGIYCRHTILFDFGVCQLLFLVSCTSWMVSLLWMLWRRTMLTIRITVFGSWASLKLWVSAVTEGGFTLLGWGGGQHSASCSTYVAASSSCSWWGYTPGVTMLLIHGSL